MRDFMTFIMDALEAVAYGIVALVIATFTAAIIMEGYDFIVDTWRMLSD